MKIETIVNDEKNLLVQDYIREKRLGNNAGFISPYSNAKGNINCLKRIASIN